MTNEYRTFKIFPDSETAHDFAGVLKQAAIPYLIEEDALVSTPTVEYDTLADRFPSGYNQNGSAFQAGTGC